MNRERIEALLWERFDGTISNDALDELAAELAENPELRLLESEIARLARDLGELQRVAPPGEMRARLGAALAVASTSAPAVRSASPVHSLRPSGGGSRRWLPLAACLLVGVAVGTLLPRIGGEAVDEHEVSGTMGRAIAPIAADQTFALGDALGRLKVTGDSTAAGIELEVPSNEEVVLTVRQSGGALLMSSFDEAGGPSSDLSVAGDTVFLRAGGEGRYILGITAADAPIPLHITVTAGDTVVAERTLDARERGGRP